MVSLRSNEDGRLDGSIVYLAEGHLPGMALQDLIAIQHALTQAAQRVTAAGQPVRYLRSMYVPAQQRLICVLATESEEAALASAELAQLPFAKVQAAFDIPLPAEI